MKNLVFVIGMLATVVLTSCRKEDNYGPKTPDPTDTTHWQTGYGNGGTLPSGGSTANVLVGTNWVMTKVQIGLSVTYTSDTIHFISPTKYTVNSNALQLTYSYYQSMSANATLTFYNYMPVNGWSVSTQIGPTFVTAGEITGAEFKDLFNASNKFNGWFSIL